MACTTRQYVKRVQAMFTEHQYQRLRAYALESGTPIGTLVRDAVAESPIAELEARRKQEALEWMTSQHLPVGDWDVMERQIESRREACDDE